MDNNYVISLIVLIVITLTYMIYRHIADKKMNDNTESTIIMENQALIKKVEQYESNIREKDNIIAELMVQKKSYDVMNKYIEQLENTITNLNEEKSKDE